MDTASKSFEKEDTRPLKIYFQDEARFGRMQNPVACWAPKGLRPQVKLQRVREYTHVYSAVCPNDGDSFSLILPYSNTDMMSIFLKEFSEYSKDYRIVMIMDGAAWHKSTEFRLFENIRIIYQPPYSPELNPVEHLWEHLREKYFRNGYWLSIDKLENDLMNALVEVSKSKETIKSLAGFHWAIF